MDATKKKTQWDAGKAIQRIQNTKVKARSFHAGGGQ